MTWQQWNSTTPVIPGLTGITVNPAPVVNPTGVLPPGAQYTPEQWAQMQQQNWQQWAQWQQQYQQWHQQYGAEYQKSMSALSQASIQPPLPNTSVPPPLPPEVKPPKPPEEPAAEDRSFTTQPNFSAPPPAYQKANQNKNISIPPGQMLNQPPPNHPSKQQMNQPQNHPPNQQMNQPQNPPPNQQMNQPQNHPPNQQMNQPQNHPPNQQMNQPQNHPPNQQMNQPQNHPPNQKMNQPQNHPPNQQMNQPQNQQPSFNYNRNNQNNRNFGNYQQNKNNQNKPPSLMSLSVKKPEFDKEPEPKQMKMDNMASQSTPKNLEFAPPAGKTDMAKKEDKQSNSQGTEELSETEKKFMKQFTEWEAQFNKWKEQNANHPDKEQYREYEKKWEAWRTQLLERREQMRRKRLGLPDNPKPQQNINVNQPKPDNVSKPSSVVSTPLENPEPEIKDDGSSFLKLTSSDGIPGLDLVGDVPDQDIPPGKDSPVIELDKSPDGQNKPEPDLEAISKGINTILGDQKLLSMLSLVSQNQKIQPASSFTDTTSRINDMRGSEKEAIETSSQGGWSNHGEQRNFETMSNFDDHSRSSFGGKQDQDWNKKNYNQDYDNSRNKNYSKGPVFRGRNQENYREFDNAPENPPRDNFENQDNFQGSRKPGATGLNFEPPGTLCDPDYRQGDDTFRDPDNFRGPDNAAVRGPNNFGAPDNFRGPNNFRGPDNFREPDNFRGPNNFRGSDNFRGPHNLRGPNTTTADGFGGSDKSRDPDNFRGANNFKAQGLYQPLDNSRGGNNFPGPNKFQRDRDNFKADDNFRGPDNSRDSKNFKGPGNLKNPEQDDFQGPDNFRGPNNFGGPGRFGGSGNFRGPNNMRGPDNFRGGNNFQARDHFRGRDNFNENDFQDEDDYDHDDNFEEQDNYDEDGDFQEENFQGNNTGGGRGFEQSGNFQDRGNLRGPNFQSQNMRDFGGNHSQFDEHMAHDEEYHEDNYDDYHDDYGHHDQNFDDNTFGTHYDEENYEEGDMQEYDEENFDSEHVPGPVGDTTTADSSPPTEPMWQPSNVIEYEHKSLKQEEIRVSIEPLRTFDYRHKPVNRIPLPQRPDWLKKTLRNCREFDFVISRYDQPSYSRYPHDRYDRYSDAPRYSDRGDDTRRRDRDDRRRPDDYRSGNRRMIEDIPSRDYGYEQTSSSRGKYEEPHREKPEDSQREKYEETGKFEEPQKGKVEEYQGVKFEPPQRLKFEPPQRGRFEEPQRGKYDDSRRGGRFEEPQRGRFEEPERLKFEEPQRGKFEESQRARFEPPQRGRFEDNQRGKYDDNQRGRFDDNQRGRFDDNQRGRFDDNQRGRFEDNQRGRFEEPASKKFCDRSYGRDMKEKEPIFIRDNSKESDDFNKDMRQKEGQNRDVKMSPPQPPATKNITLIEDILNPPGRFSRPARIVIILRGPPGSGKTFLAKLIKDKEVENGGSAPRILSLDDYFMVEQEKEVEEDGKKSKVKVMEYEYDGSMEIVYRNSLFKAFKKTITDGYFPFIIVDNINDKVKYFGEMWSFAKQNGFQVYICQLEFDLATCTKRNTHNRSETEIQKIINTWEQTPSHHPSLDATSLMQSGSIPEVEMEEINSPPSEDFDDDAEEKACGSKWDNFDCSLGNLAKLDGTSKPLRASKTMEDYLQIDDEWVSRESKPGQKRVRWADLEERKEQQKMRAIGFVVGQTNWDRMMDPTMGSSALTQTKYIERVPRFYKD